MNILNKRIECSIGAFDFIALQYIDDKSGAKETAIARDMEQPFLRLPGLLEEAEAVAAVRGYHAARTQNPKVERWF